ncbi:MAG: hypothetical protein COV10_00580 [Candidatus Vogelbacteria bacterium CG10_big_fil_rev_8_21_14_0_10_51_16]|uniref:Uncharacterized protein n=1 Tax=Candidatus Vogelbacteria bacterium CG10_big_fil_rev_8_21_14_0_10_51_16 TaxID=1975045 RepID=A0A2H0RFD7_9BACT|nr:MAG: hypothetical protein COV10_00580 [Candidatus Vogelbacteria bacterium CG10_big_fil_rev_8_21_14_0_10_51_16]
MNHRIRDGLLVALGALVAIPALVAAAPWAGPTAQPPGLNKEAPVHVGGDRQSKIGRLDLGTALPTATRGEESSNKHYGLITPSRVGAAGLCLGSGTNSSCIYSWSEVGGGSGNCIINNSTNTIVCTDANGIETTASLGLWQAHPGLSRWVQPKADKGVHATSGFVLESRSSNPSGATELIAGRMWYCTGNHVSNCPTN